MTNMRGKVWGQTSLLYATPILELHLLEVDAGGYCSEHVHRAKTNIFYVLKGELEITTWPLDESAKPDLTVLRAGDMTIVMPGTWHKFKANENTVCLEVYEAVLSQDIVRRTVGGRQDP